MTPRPKAALALAALVVAALAVPRSGASSSAPAASDLARRFQADVTVLASDAMEGRGLGTAGLGKAADWIEARLRALHLRPAFGGAYRQPFEVKTGVTLEPGNTLADVAEAEWVPLGMSSSGAFAGELAFVGYGIEAPAIGYRELEGIDLHGKVALMLRYEPQEKDEASPFDGRKPSRWSALRYKVYQAQGARRGRGRLRDRPPAGRGQGQPPRPPQRRPREPGGDLPSSR